MRKYIAILMVVFVCCSKKEDLNVWEYEQFSTEIKSKNINLVKDEVNSDVYAYFNFELALNETKYLNDDKDLLYNIEYDSVIAEVNTKKLKIEYSFRNDSVIITSSEAIYETGDLELTIWGSWFYRDRQEQKYTDGNPVYIEPVSQTIKLHTNSKLPIEAFKGFEENEQTNSIYYEPIVNLRYVPDIEYKKENIRYKYALEYYLKHNNQSIDLTYKSLEHNVIQLMYNGSLELDQKYQFGVIAKWFRQDSRGLWQSCQGYDEILEQEIISVEASVPEITSGSFLATYPISRQFHFLKDEYNKGYFLPKDRVLAKYLTNNDLFVTIYDIINNESENAVIKYNENNNSFEYDLPTEFLKNEIIYKLSLFNSENEDESIYDYHFRTSYYNTFTEKWNGEGLLSSYSNMWSMSQLRPGESLIIGYSFGMNVFPVNEEMDRYENNSSTLMSSEFPLIQFSSEIPEIMQGTSELALYSIDNITINRDDKYEKFGYPPLDAIYFSGDRLFLSDEYINGGEYILGNIYTWVYFVTALAALDLDPVVARVNSAYPDKEKIRDKVTGLKIELPSMEISYVLPGINIATTTFNNYVIPGWVDEEN